MTKLEIQLLLEQAYESTFLDSIELLKNKNKDYKKSNFYKETRIPLAQLYQSFFAYQKTNMDIADKINHYLNNIDTDIIVNKMTDFIENDKVKEIINVIIEKFDFEKLMEASEELNKSIQNLKG